uniref:Putative secreted protein n=1 Tax=Amblyomma triste TaxID=251400 RepID=A0A023G2A3_AMBTT
MAKRTICAFFLVSVLLALQATTYARRRQSATSRPEDGSGTVELEEVAEAEQRMLRAATLIRQTLQQRTPAPGGILVLVADTSMAQQYEDYFRSAYRTLPMTRALDSLSARTLAARGVTLTTGAAMARALQRHTLALSDLSLILADNAADLFSGEPLDSDVVGSSAPFSTRNTLKIVGFKRPGWTVPLRTQREQPPPIPVVDQPLGLDVAARALRFPQRFVDEKLSPYTFRNHDLLLRALLHPSKARRINSTVSYRPLDYVGQFALEYVLLRHILKNGTLKTNQEMHEAKTRVLRQETLARVAALNDLDKYVFVDDGPQKLSMTQYANQARSQASSHSTPDIRQNSFLHNFLQSVAGAVYIDSGYDADIVERVFVKFFKPYL